jgi:hypothetical protein
MGDTVPRGSSHGTPWVLGKASKLHQASIRTEQLKALCHKDKATLESTPIAQLKRISEKNSAHGSAIAQF